MNAKFSVDPVIEKQSIFIKNMALSTLFLKNDKENPWFVLVPRKMGAVELIDLNHEEQSILMEEMTIISEFLKLYYRPHKLNIGSLGNIVQQLHFHIIARYPTDRAWPGPIWGSPTTQEFDSNEIENLKSNFLEFLD
jgi:diadenosine tetraphosphate (Ap4A) HIT family hydrolase